MFVRVQDRDTGHQYDVDERNVNPELHLRVNSARWPHTSRPRPAKPRLPLGTTNPAARTEGPSGTAETVDTPGETS